MVDMVASLSEEATSRKSFPVDFSLVDENDQPHLRIDDGQEPHLLVMRVTNRSGRDMELMADAQGKRTTASAAFHHFRLTFRPGVLSARTREALANPRAAQGLLGADAALWHLAPAGEEKDGSVSLALVFTGDDPVLLAGKTLSTRMQGIAAGGASARPTRVELHLGQVRHVGEDTPIPGAGRHCHVYLLHGGRRDLPLQIGFRGSGVIRADEKPDKLVVELTNRSPDTAFGAGKGGAPAHFMLWFDWKTGYWSLFDGIERKIPTITAAARPSGALLPVEHLGRQQEDNPLRWRLNLPADGIPPGNHAISIHIDGIVAGSEGPTNLYLDSYNIPGYANSRTILVITRSLVTPDILKEKLDAVESRMAVIADRLNGLDSTIKMSVVDQFEIPPARAPTVGAWAPNAGPFPADSRQTTWEQLLDTAMDVSRGYVLGDGAAGTVYPLVEGRLGPALPEPPARLDQLARDSFLREWNLKHPRGPGGGGLLPPDPPPTRATYVEIGEFRGLPMILNTNGELYCHHPHEPNNHGWHLVSGDVRHVGDGWIAMAADGGSVLSTPARLDVRYPDGLQFYVGSSPAKLPAPIVNVGGTAGDPLFVDAEGNVWGKKRYTDEWTWEIRLKQAAEDINAFGVLIRKAKQGIGAGTICRYDADGWKTLSGSGMRVGGTWHNPVVIRNRALYRLTGGS